MIKKLLPASSHSPASLKVFEALLALSMLLGLGPWQMYKGWEHPVHIGWTTSGAILIVGMIVCLCLIWRRRGTRYSATASIMFTMQVANVAEGILKWHAKSDGATWPKMNSALAVAFLAVIIWEEKNRRKEAARDATCEFKIFDMKDTL